MPEKGVRGVGITASHARSDLSDLPRILDEVEALGVESIELPFYDMDLVVGGRIRRPHLDRLKAACKGRGVAFTVHGPLAINFFDEPQRLSRHLDVLQASLEAAAEVGALHYVVHSGIGSDRPPEALEDAYARQREHLGRAGDVAKDLGLLLCVENLFGSPDGAVHASTPRRLAAELSAIDHSHVRATFDVSHAFLRLEGAEAALVEEAQALAPFAHHLHVHDSFGRPDAIWSLNTSERLAFGHGDLHLPVGWGGIPWDALMDACVFPAGAVFNIELNPRFWYAVAEAVAATRTLAAKARTGLTRTA